MSLTRSVLESLNFGMKTDNSLKRFPGASVSPYFGLSYRLSDRLLARLWILPILPILSVSIVKTRTSELDSGPTFALSIGLRGLGW